MTRWGMVIDLKKCAGCQTCTIACKVENFVPPDLFFTRVNDYELGKYPTVQRHFLPIGCMHCRDAPCVQSCPTGASSKREDGIVLVDQDKCVGCRYCMVVCPYGARQFNERADATYFKPGPTPFEKFGARRYRSGVVIKCNLCADRIDLGVKRGLTPGVDRDATPACVASCIAGARYFCDLDDQESEGARLVRARGGWRLREELGTDPSIFYLPR